MQILIILWENAAFLLKLNYAVDVLFKYKIIRPSIEICGFCSINVFWSITTLIWLFWTQYLLAYILYFQTENTHSAN